MLVGLLDALASSFLPSRRTVLTLATVAVAVPLGVLLIAAEFQLRHAATSDGDSGTQSSRINCSACGARTSDDGACDYCAEPLNDEPSDGDSSDDPTTDAGWSDETGWS